MKLGRKYHFGRAILCTCRKIYEEALHVLRWRRSLFIKLNDWDSYLLALWWINNLGNDLLLQINTLEIDNWLGYNRSLDTAVFRRYCYSCSIGMTDRPGLNVKHTIPDDDNPMVFRYSSQCLKALPLFDRHLRDVVFGMFGNGQHTIIDTDLLEKIVQTFARYSTYGYLCLPSARNIVHVQKPIHRFRSVTSLQRWFYILPASLQAPSS